MSESIEIWFEIRKDATGYPESEDWEQLYAWPVEHGFRIDNIPFFVKDVAVGDIVSADLTDEGHYRFVEKLAASGHSTFRIWLTEAAQAEAGRIMEGITAIGGEAEITLDRLIAIDAPPDCEPQIWTLLEEGRASGQWDLQVGCSPD